MKQAARYRVALFLATITLVSTMFGAPSRSAGNETNLDLLSGPAAWSEGQKKLKNPETFQQGLSDLERLCFEGQKDTNWRNYACMSYAAALVENPKGTSADLIKAIDARGLACTAGAYYIKTACYLAGQALISNNEGIESDPPRAASYFEIGCLGNRKTNSPSRPSDGGLSCLNLAVMHDRGIGISVDTEQARKYYQISCKAKMGYACFVLAKPLIAALDKYVGEMKSSKGDFASGRQFSLSEDEFENSIFLENACEAEEYPEAQACLYRGLYQVYSSYSFRLMKMVDDPPEKGTEAHDYMMALFRTNRRNKMRADVFFKRGCVLGNKVACDFLSVN